MPRFKLNPDDLPTLTGEQHAQLDAMTDADIEAAAKADADNPLLTADEISRIAKQSLSQ